MSIERKIVLVPLKAVLVRVKMADVLTGKHFNGENCIQSVILESELTVVVRKSFVCIPGSLFSNAYCCLWNSGEYISTIVCILHGEGRKTAQSYKEV